MNHDNKSVFCCFGLMLWLSSSILLFLWNYKGEEREELEEDAWNDLKLFNS